MAGGHAGARVCEEMVEGDAVEVDAARSSKRAPNSGNSPMRGGGEVGAGVSSSVWSPVVLSPGRTDWSSGPVWPATPGGKTRPGPRTGIWAIVVDAGSAAPAASGDIRARASAAAEVFWCTPAFLHGSVD